MDEVNREDVRFLELVGGFIDFLAQRCQYLLEHPSGAPGKSISLDDGTLEVGVLVRGALVDVLAETGCRMFEDLAHVANFDLPTQESVFVGFRLGSNEEPKGTGAKLLKTLARTSRVVTASGGIEWQLEIDAESLRRGLTRAAQKMYHLRLRDAGP